ncbi:hypothetical protein QR685DRAFT_77239 [Neurospora intermedia]|uniref:Uncharacterized protein n=1 Tax=Neurospora intermedia TaxID=5142 RepID=A0ABR3D395_NEUIN
MLSVIRHEKKCSILNPSDARTVQWWPSVVGIDLDLCGARWTVGLITQESTTNFLIFFLWTFSFIYFFDPFLALSVVQPLFPSRQEVTPSFSNGAIPTKAVSWPCVRGFSSTHLRMPARAAAGYCVSSFSSPHHVWKIYLSLPMRCPTLAYIHVAAKHVHTPLTWYPIVLILLATPCQSVETVNHPVNKPVSLSQASLLRSRQKVEKPYLHSGPVAGGNALG